MAESMRFKADFIGRNGPLAQMMAQSLYEMKPHIARAILNNKEIGLRMLNERRIEMMSQPCLGVHKTFDAKETPCHETMKQYRVESWEQSDYDLIMPITLDEIVEEVSQLPTDVVAELMDRIMAARHGGIDPSVEAAWKTEIHRRIAEIEQGKVQGIPIEEVMARVRKTVGL